jgi:hypothetical protein
MKPSKGASWIWLARQEKPEATGDWGELHRFQRRYGGAETAIAEGNSLGAALRRDKKSDRLDGDEPEAAHPILSTAEKHHSICAR